MNSPICDFLKEYEDSKKKRLHMPGHKGDKDTAFAGGDITEIEGADVLYSPKGIILESEKNAEALFKTKRTVYSTEGSSLSVRAMLYLTALYARSRKQKPRVLAFRNAHKSFISAIGLLDIEVDFVYPTEDEAILCCNVCPDRLKKIISEYEEKPTALYVTSPDYLGNMLNIKEYAKICHEAGMLLLVDNAHGAYLAFLEESRHPIAEGADMCCDSAHKTLPAITGSAYLHIGKRAPEILVDMADEAMAIFASTSPSYLILASLDAANVKLSSHFPKDLNAFVKLVDAAKDRIRGLGYTVPVGEPTKITILPKGYGYTGRELADILYANGFVCEFSDNDHVVMMLAPKQENILDELISELAKIPRKTPIMCHAPLVPHPKRALSIREAMFSPSVEIKAREAIGRTLATVSVSCPPAIPIMICGEVVDEECIKIFEYYGTDQIRVVER